MLVFQAGLRLCKMSYEEIFLCLFGMTVYQLLFLLQASINLLDFLHDLCRYWLLWWSEVVFHAAL